MFFSCFFLYKLLQVWLIYSRLFVGFTPIWQPIIKHLFLEYAPSLLHETVTPMNIIYHQEIAKKFIRLISGTNLSYLVTINWVSNQ